MNIRQFGARRGRQRCDFGDERATAVRVNVGPVLSVGAHFADSRQATASAGAGPQSDFRNEAAADNPPGIDAFNSAGVPAAMTCPWSMIARRWHSASASSMLWVVSRMVFPAWWYSRMISHNRMRVCGSSPALGSSRNSTCGIVHHGAGNRKPLHHAAGKSADHLVRRAR